MMIGLGSGRHDYVCRCDEGLQFAAVLYLSVFGQ